MAESFDEFFERALSLDVLTEAEVDALTDAVASGALSEVGAIERHRAALDAALHPRTIGVVLDLHYVQIATRSFGQLTAFSPLAFEAALVDKCGGGVVSARWACDAAPPDGEEHPHAKKTLHAALRAAGYTLVLSAPKASGTQGATDVDVACSIFRVAGAFEAAAAADTLALVAGDADFRPALAAVLAARKGLRVCIVAEDQNMSKAYKSWISSAAAEADVSRCDLAALMGTMAPGVVDLRGAARPARADSDGRSADAAAAVAACAAAVARGAKAITLNLSGGGGPAWGDGHTAELVQLLSRGQPPVGAALQQLWLHHLPISDGSCEAIAAALGGGALTALEELHISDSNVSVAGLRAIAAAARRAGCGGGDGRAAPRRRKLYVNARHIGGGDAVAVAKEFSGAITLRLAAPGGAPAGGRGAGNGAPPRHWSSGGAGRVVGEGRGGGGRGRGEGRGRKGGGGGRGGYGPPAAHASQPHAAQKAPAVDLVPKWWGDGGEGGGRRGGGRGGGGRGGGGGARGGGGGARAPAAGYTSTARGGGR